jgi:hypothetical protein
MISKIKASKCKTDSSSSFNCETKNDGMNDYQRIINCLQKDCKYMSEIYGWPETECDCLNTVYNKSCENFETDELEEGIVPSPLPYRAVYDRLTKYCNTDGSAWNHLVSDSGPMRDCCSLGSMYDDNDNGDDNGNGDNNNDDDNGNGDNNKDNDNDDDNGNGDNNKDNDNNDDNGNGDNNKSSSGLSTGSIICISIGVLLLIILIVCMFIFFI